MLQKERQGTPLRFFPSTMEVLSWKQNHQGIVLAGRFIYRNKDLTTNIARSGTAGLTYTKTLLNSGTVGSENWRLGWNFAMVFISILLPLSRVNPKVKTNTKVF